MLYNTEGIVIKSIAYGEAHAILTLLTPGGIVAVMARGAKKPQSRLRAGIGPCVKGIYSIYQRSGMGNLQQVEVIETFKRFREDIDLAAFAAYFCELAMIVSSEPSIGSQTLYGIVEQLLQRLHDNREEAIILARIWETKVLSILGSAPDWQRCVKCSVVLNRTSDYSTVDGGFLCDACASKTDYGTSKYIRVSPSTPHILHKFANVPFARLGQVSLSEATLKSLRVVLANQLAEFAGVSLKTRTVLESLCSEEFLGTDQSKDTQI